MKTGEAELAGTARRRRRAWAAAAIVAATLAAYWPSLSGAFLWNDSDYVTAPGLRSLGGLGRIWTRLGATQQYYPLLHSFFWMQHRLWGDRPLGYHLVTIFLHAGSALLLVAVLRRLAIRGARLAGLLFALHPVHVESVAWIAEQKNTLSLVFYLAAAWYYLRFDERRDATSYAAGFALFLCSLGCKTVTATLPAALWVVLWWKRGRLEGKRDISPLLPWLAAGGLAGGFSRWVERRYVGAVGREFEASFLERVLGAGRAVWFYLGHLLWPAHLNFVYTRWSVDPGAWWQWLFPLGVLAALGAAWAARRRTRAPLAAGLFFVGSLFPVLGFVNLYGARYSRVWDHWQYLADLGPIALGAASLVLAEERWPLPRRLGQAALLALALLLGALTWHHARLFRDDETLYRATIARNPACWMAYNNLGLVVSQQGRPQEGMDDFRRAIALNPDWADAHFNLGAALATAGHPTEAVAEYEAALRFEPDFRPARLALAEILAAAGQVREAAAQDRLGLEWPPTASAHAALADVLRGEGRAADALAEFRAALRLDPDYQPAQEGIKELSAPPSAGRPTPP